MAQNGLLTNFWLYLVLCYIGRYTRTTLPLGWKATCLGPEPGAGFDGSLGIAVILLQGIGKSRICRLVSVFLPHLGAGFANPAEHHGDSQRADYL